MPELACPSYWSQAEAASLYILTDTMSKPAALAPLIIGLFIDSILLGVLGALMFDWLSHKDEERGVVRFAVISTALVGFGVSILSVVWIVYMFAFQYGRYGQFTDYRWLSFYPIVDAYMVVVVQSFYAERAYKVVGRYKIILVAVGVPLLASVVGALAVATYGNMFNRLDMTYNIFIWMWICGTCVADVVITCAVMWGLLRSRSEWEQTDKLVKRLIRVALESQLPPTIIALSLLIDFAVQGGTFWGVFFEMIQGKFYVVGMVYVLNQRHNLRRHMDDGTMSGYRNTNAYNMNPNNHRNRVLAALGPATIHVQTETYVESHKISPAFIPTKIEPKLREPSESGTEVTSIDYSGVNQSEVGLNSAYMDRVRQKKNTEFKIDGID